MKILCLSTIMYCCYFCVSNPLSKQEKAAYPDAIAVALDTVNHRVGQWNDLINYFNKLKYILYNNCNAKWLYIQSCFSSSMLIISEIPISAWTSPVLALVLLLVESFSQAWCVFMAGCSIEFYLIYWKTWMWNQIYSNTWW